VRGFNLISKYFVDWSGSDTFQLFVEKQRTFALKTGNSV